MIPPYMNLTEMDGRPVTVFLQGIVMIASGTHGGAYIQLILGGISTQESYDIVKGRLYRLDELTDEERMKTVTQSSKCICGGEPHVSHCPANPDPFLRVIV